MIDRHNLPDDIPALKGIIFQLLDVIEEQRRQIADLKHQVECLTHQVQALQRHRYGPRSERTSGIKAIAKKTPQEKQAGHGRRKLPDDLPRMRRDHDIDSHVCQKCGGLLVKIGEIACEQLDAVPPQLYVIDHRRAKYGCRHCRETVVAADMPAQPIDKGLAAPGLLAEVLVNKYQDHLPLYRLSQRFWRMGIVLPRSTLCGWVMACAGLLAPLVQRMSKRDLIPCGHLFSDDTPIRVLEREEGAGKTGRFWIYTGKGNAEFKACTVYDYSPTREGKWPVDFLAVFEGYLQADAYAGYDKIYQDQGQGVKVKENGCWAHVRRPFYECAQGTPEDSLANQGLVFIRLLYKIESQARAQKLNDKETKLWRQERAPPILETFHTWLKSHKDRVLPKSPLAQAIGYTLNHWEALNAYLLEGFLEIDNNRAERGIRPLAVGRKNYLFVGNDGGGKAAAVIYSLLETCKQHGVNPWAYLKDVLERISTHPNSQIDELLPYNWKPSQEQTSMNRQLKMTA